MAQKPQQKQGDENQNFSEKLAKIAVTTKARASEPPPESLPQVRFYPKLTRCGPSAPAELTEEIRGCRGA